MSGSNGELIAEAVTRAELCDADSREAMRDTGRIILRLADALEAAEERAEGAERLAEVRRETIREYGRENENWSVRAHTAERELQVAEDQANNLAGDLAQAEKERDTLAAVVERVEDYVTRHYLDTEMGRSVLDILATAPDDALREHEAALIEEMADEVHATLSDPNRKRPRDPRGEFATDLLNDVAWAVHLIREKARQRREEKP